MKLYMPLCTTLRSQFPYRHFCTGPSRRIEGLIHRVPQSLVVARRGSTRAMASAGEGGKPALQKRSVVSSFLYKFVDENGERKAKVALFKRSGKVRTYQ